MGKDLSLAKKWTKLAGYVVRTQILSSALTPTEIFLG